MQDILKDIGINIGISIAGLFGSLILIGKNAALKWKTSVFSIITGVASANYITPVAVDMQIIKFEIALVITVIIFYCF